MWRKFKLTKRLCETKWKMICQIKIQVLGDRNQEELRQKESTIIIKNWFRCMALSDTE